MRIKKNDKVKVLSGKDRGKIGTVVKVLPKANKVIVEGVNIVKRHEKMQKGDTKKGGIISSEGPISASKVQLIDAKTNKPTRIGFRIEKGKKVRYTKKSNEVI